MITAFFTFVTVAFFVAIAATVADSVSSTAPSPEVRLARRANARIVVTTWATFARKLLPPDRIVFRTMSIEPHRPSAATTGATASSRSPASYEAAARRPPGQPPA